MSEYVLCIIAVAGAAASWYCYGRGHQDGRSEGFEEGRMKGLLEGRGIGGSASQAARAGPAVTLGRGGPGAPPA